MGKIVIVAIDFVAQLFSAPNLIHIVSRHPSYPSVSFIFLYLALMLLARHVELNMACRTTASCVLSRYLIAQGVERLGVPLQGLTMLSLNALMLLRADPLALST